MDHSCTVCGWNDPMTPHCQHVTESMCFSMAVGSFTPDYMHLTCNTANCVCNCHAPWGSMLATYWIPPPPVQAPDDCYDCIHEVTCARAVKHFDPAWGISPLCFAGNHGHCGEVWNTSWPSLKASDEDCWKHCVCDCHGLISDKEWAALADKLRQLRA